MYVYEDENFRFSFFTRSHIPYTVEFIQFSCSLQYLVTVVTIEILKYMYIHMNYELRYGQKSPTGTGIMVSQRELHRFPCLTTNVQTSVQTSPGDLIST